MADEVTSSYLSQLKFPEEKRGGLLWQYITNIRVVLLFVLTIVLAGLFAFNDLPRRLNPEINIPIVSVTTIFPGAAPNDIEELVTIPLEDSLAGVENITSIRSSSRESVSSIVIEFSSGTDPKTAESDVSRVIEKATTLPGDVETPTVAAFDFENQPVLVFALEGKEGDEASLYRFAETLKTSLTDLGVVDRVAVSGGEEREIQVLVPVEKLTQLGINPLDLSRAIGSAVQSLPVGSAQTESGVYAITLAPTVSSVDELRRLPVTVGGVTRPLGDVAIISERTKPLSARSYISRNGQEANPIVVFDVFKTSQANIDRAVEAAQEETTRVIRLSGGNFSTVDLLNGAKEIDDEFGSLAGNFRDTIILVFLTLFVFLGVRQATISALTIPLTFLVTFAVMNAIGVSLNFLSLFALLLALGLLVDDTIVVVTAMTAYYRTKRFTPAETGILVWKDFIIPIWTTTIATVWAFVPLLLSGGIIGEFIRTIPLVVAIALYTSTAIAVLITLPLMVSILDLRIAYRVRIFFLIVSFLLLIAGLVVLLRGNTLISLIVLVFVVLLFVLWQTRTVLASRFRMFFEERPGVLRLFDRVKYYFTHGIINSETLSLKYKDVVLKILYSKANRIRTVVTVVLFFVFSVALLALGFVKNEFFPKTSADTFYMNVELPNGTVISETDAVARQLVKDVSLESGVSEVVGRVGSNFSGDGGGGGSANGSNLAQLTVSLSEENSIEVAERIRAKYSSFEQGRVSVVELSGGPPVGADLQIKLFGEDLSNLSQYGDNLATYLSGQEGVINIEKSIKEGTSQIQYIPGRTKFAEIGLPVDSAGLLLRTFASGFTLDTVRFNETSYDVVLRVSGDGAKVEDLTKMTVTTPQGAVVPLAALGRFEMRVNPTLITRENGQRTLSVSANVRPGFNVSDINRGLEEEADRLELPEGYSWSTGGVNEENANSVRSILQAMVLALVLILITMIIQFSSFRSALIVTLVIPPAIAGVFFVFALTGTPLSFPALIGVLALYGIVVNNAIQLVDRINNNLKSGLEFVDAIADAGASRFEPILFGSLTTIVGLVPITIQDPLWRGLGGAIISGLLFSGVIMLFFIPVVYYYWYLKSVTPGRK